ncbi:MAG: restriction endonuclease subunit S [Acidobacteriales bacterium]|nr:restriction endonuclease subunit S [Terriglobales bacterium]
MDWKPVPLSDLATFSRGVSWSKDEESCDGSGTVVVSIPNVKHGRIEIGEAKHRLKHCPKPSKLLALDDVLFVGSSGSIDNVARNARVTILPGEPVAFASFTFKATPNTQTCDPEFFYYLMNSPLARFADFARRAADGKFNFQLVDFVKRSSFQIPEKPEQRQIARVLSAVRREIERQEQLIALTAELKKALMQRLFTEGTRGEPLKQTDIGTVPKGWELHRLRDLIQIKHGYAFDGAYFRDRGEKILMTPGHFSEEGGFREQGGRTKFYVGEVPAGYTLSPNDLLVAMTEQKAGLLGSAALVPPVGTYLHNQRLGLVTIVDAARLTKDFLYFFFNRWEVKAQISSTASGSKVRHTSPSKLLDLIIALPKRDEQGEIALVLHAADAKKLWHQRTFESLSSLFRTLLHQLMTAQVRVHDLDLSALDEPAVEPAGVT